MPFFEYTWLASTYRPQDLSPAETSALLDFVFAQSLSVYDIFKSWKQAAKQFGTKSPAYKDIHKWVKRLAQAKLVEHTLEYHERGAIHYRITTYGLITALERATQEYDSYFIGEQKQSSIIQSLLLQFFEEETIDSFYTFRDFPQAEIGNYLYECGSITKDICKRIWTRIDKYKLTDILPSDHIIQKYMAYLDGKLVDQDVINEIKKYEIRLKDRLNNGSNIDLANELDRYDGDYLRPHTKKYYEANSGNPYIRDFGEDKPPFPLGELYFDIVVSLSLMLEEKIKSLAFTLVLQMGDIINYEKMHNREELEEMLEGSISYLFKNMLKDKKFTDLIRVIKTDFDLGYKQFMYYHKQSI